MGILNIDLNNINLDDNFDEDDLDTIIHVRLLNLKTKKELNEELMPVVWHPIR